MDFRLRVFLSVAQYLNFTAAAKQLHISQPAVTKHIQELEATYGAELFKRQNGKIQLTFKGEIFREYAFEIVKKYDELWANMQMASMDFEGEIRLGVSAGLMESHLYSLLSKIYEKFPCASVIVVIKEQHLLCEALRKKEIDVAMMHCSDNLQGFIFEKFTGGDAGFVVMEGCMNKKIETFVEFSKLWYSNRYE